MESRYVFVFPLLALGLAGYAQTGSCADNVSSLAGVYSSAHPITVDGVKMTTNGYIEIDPNGQITAFEQEGEGQASAGSGCYRLATGTATNAGLQGRMLTRGVSPRGDAVYQTLAGDADTFGILIEPSGSVSVRWFFHAGRANNTFTVNGSKNVVNSVNGSSYSISLPALDSPTPNALRSMLCHTESPDLPQATAIPALHMPQAGVDTKLADRDKVASNPVAAGTVGQTASPTSAGTLPLPFDSILPFEMGKPLDTTAFARFGVAPGSSKAQIVTDWGQKIVADPDIEAYFLPRPADPSAAKSAAMSRALDIMDGLRRISQSDRELLAGISERALDNAPPDCGGTRSLSEITKRYLSIETESDEAFSDQMHATLDLLKQSTLKTPPPQITASQRVQGQLALSASIEDALKHDPSEADDLGVLLSGKQAELSQVAWCKATRFYHDAFDKTPEPARDWFMLAGIEDRRNLTSASVTMQKGLASTAQTLQQPAVTSTAVDYADAVQKRVRPNIIWNGKPVYGETMVAVSCTSTGNLKSVRIIRSSGDLNWDSAALAAVRRSDPMPLDKNGEAHQSFEIALRPGF